MTPAPVNMTLGTDDPSAAPGAGGGRRTGAVGFVPVRAGSKGIPGKNVRPLAGKPLVLWVLEAASASGVLDEVVVATDGAEIREIVEAARLPRVRVVDRDPAHATDSASTESVMLEHAGRGDFDTFVLLQATSPLTSAQDIRGALELYRQSGADSLVTAARQRRFIWQVGPDGGARPINYDPASRPRRQDFDGYLVENGAISICSREGLIRTGSRLHGRIALYEMPEETAIELDETHDWEALDSLLRSRSTATGTLAATGTPAAAGAGISPEHPHAARLRDIAVLLTDVDGVLTDAGMYYGESGEELKKFNTRDGRGLQNVREIGVLTGIVTTERTQLVERRAQKLKVDFLHQGVGDKREVLAELSASLNIPPTRFAFIGDDLNDLGILGEVGFAACPADAAPEVRAIVDHVCATAGGAGAVRELCDLICQAQAANRTA